MKPSILLFLLLFIDSSTIASGAEFPKIFMGKWAPTFGQCKQFPWGNDPNLIEIKGGSLISYESNSNIGRFEEVALNEFLLSGLVSGEDMTSEFTYKFVYLEKSDSIAIRYFDEGEKISYVRCPK